ncbi:nicotinamidase-related amidase [Streptomyces collinus]
MPPTTALLVVDMQNATVAMAHRAAETVAAIAGLSERARAAGVPVVTVRQQDAVMVPGTEGWRVVPALAPRGRGSRSWTRRPRTASWAPTSTRS